MITDALLNSAIRVLNSISSVAGKIAWQLEEIQREKRVMEAEKLNLPK